MNRSDLNVFNPASDLSENNTRERVRDWKQVERQTNSHTTRERARGEAKDRLMIIIEGH